MLLQYQKAHQHIVLNQMLSSCCYCCNVGNVVVANFTLITKDIFNKLIRQLAYANLNHSK